MDSRRNSFGKKDREGQRRDETGVDRLRLEREKARVPTPLKLDIRRLPATQLPHGLNSDNPFPGFVIKKKK
ncbi:MAG: hypothetical protein V1644_02115 [Candidatus Micrarchaeota archaeon]